jgi:NUMOD3 motif
MILKHKHHIVPKHMGGSNDPSNLIELSIPDHALAHKKLWEVHSKEEDRIAWLTLSGQISKAEASIRAKQTPQFRMKKRLERLGKKQTEEHRRNMGKTKIGNTNFLGKTHTDETKNKIAKTKEKSFHVQKPDGTMLTIINLKKFCAQENLNWDSVRGYISMNRTYKGYNIKRVNENG